MPRRKPRGINGVTRLTGGIGSAEFIPTELPGEKAGIESEICARALRAMRANDWKVWPSDSEPRQLDEDDFDFVFDTRDGREYLDLAEVAPLEEVKGGYEGAPKTVPRGKLVDAILRVVARKGAHYGHPRSIRVHLLFYITDFRFMLSNGVVMLLSWALYLEHHGFASISFYAPINQEAGYLEILYPVPGGVRYLSPQDVARMRVETVTNHDPRGWKFDPERGGFFAG